VPSRQWREVAVRVEAKVRFGGQAVADLQGQGAKAAGRVSYHGEVVAKIEDSERRTFVRVAVAL
jgi:hypothetical protein